MHKIAVLICWHSPYSYFPWYFKYFLHSCSFNSSIDFFIFSDIEYRSYLPNNVIIIKKSRQELKTLASKKLGFTVADIESPRKICDFIPAYGLIFEEYIKGYDFWGNSDLDIIYGNLREFITDDILNDNHVISVRHDFLSSFFVLYKNIADINTLFKRSKDYKAVFTTKEFLGFDELNHQRWQITRIGKDWSEIKTDIESFMQLIKKAQQANEIKAHFDFMALEGKPGKIKFEDGSLIYNSKYEVALYHLTWLKRIYQPKRVPEIIPNVYYISPTKMYTKKINKAPL